VPDVLAFEDFPPGEIVDYGGIEVSADEIIVFAREFDPQPFCIDEGAARAAPSAAQGFPNQGKEI